MKKLGLIIITIVSFYACKKETTQTPTQVASLLNEIDGKQFRKSSILISADSIVDTIPTIDAFTVLPDCKKDNIWSFNKTAKVFTIDEGPHTCVPTDPQIKDQGTLLEINSNDLKVVGTSTNEIWNIESRTSSSFRVSYFAKNASNKTVKFRVTFTKI